MSTPTTATATLPHYNPYNSHHYLNSHHQTYQDPRDPSAVAYRVNNPTLSSSRPRPLYPPQGYFASSNAATNPSNGPLNSPAFTTSRVLNEEDTDTPSPARTALSYAEMPPVRSITQDTQPSRKRRRSKEPDWNDFYKNGLPKEIIVIDDSPEPEPAQQVAKETAAAYPVLPLPISISSGSTVGHNTASAGVSHHIAKKRRRDEPAHYDPVYHNTYAGSHAETPHGHHTPAKSTVSSDRTTSAVQTTAATSLDSLSSGSSNSYDYLVNIHAGQKRKRTTRQQIATEAKRREAEASDALLTYQPPPHPPKKASDIPVTKINDVAYNKGAKFDDDDGHYVVVPGAELTDRYQMDKLLGQGTFGKVVKAIDRGRGKNGEWVAIKIIRSVQKYRDASKIELRVLRTLQANDATNRNRCIHLRDCFDYRGHICIVMDLLGQSVFDFLKSNNFVPFPNIQIQHFARQLLTSVAFLHDLNLIHTDLKPENILLCHSDYQTFTYNRRIPSSSGTVQRQANQRRVLLDTEIRLIDFGSATFQDEYHSSVVSTRHYRAPEIILGLGWSYSCDIWSIGCILVEFFTGDALFQTHENLEHLAMMEQVVGSGIDTQLVSQVNRMTRNGGNSASKYFKRLKLDYPQADTSRASKRFVKAMKRLDDIIPRSNDFLEQFLDLLHKIFVYDPAKRITAKEALKHPWFKMTPTPDDGSEAAKIRLDRMKKNDGHRQAPIHI
ncbi:kinase-like domain-containing protein [Coniochaeta sp. 2T2.1]|nr:kinase-like domain-containing protein [Coniochaeta sp. 2T2.1]